MINSDKYFDFGPLMAPIHNDAAFVRAGIDFWRFWVKTMTEGHEIYGKPKNAQNSMRMKELLERRDLVLKQWQKYGPR